MSVSLLQNQKIGTTSSYPRKDGFIRKDRAKGGGLEVFGLRL